MGAQLLRAFSLEGIPANEAYVADLNNDGRPEVLFLQSPGILQSRIFSPGRPFWDAPYDASGRTRRTDYCLTAVDPQGRVIWQYGRPKAYVDAIECLGHVADQMVCCDDINGDGKTEVAFVCFDRLVLLEGATGRVLQQTGLDADNYGIVRPAATRQGKRLLVKNTERGHAPHWYADPALIFDAELNLVARLGKTVGSGHSPRALDLNGDGDEEILIGYEAYTADGHRLWRLEGQDPATYDDNNHVDQLQAGPFGEGGALRIVYAGSRMVYVGTPEGRLVWQRELGHPQHVLVGDFRAGGARAHLAILSVLHDNVLFFFRGDGALVNVLNPPPMWPENPEKIRGAHSGEGLLIYPQGCPDGSDAVITRDWGWPRVYDLAGNEPFAFPPPGEGESAARISCPRSAAEDEALRREGLSPGSPVVTRESYGIRIFDADGDGRAEVLIHNLRRAWLYKPPYPAAGAPNTHARLRPVTGQGWYALPQ
ncbi:MAG: hypothetical protein HY321_02970 [Armatimonadetes bacterium]|nr:hypothetical protein [Armatimonadota bacterium]